MSQDSQNKKTEIGIGSENINTEQNKQDEIYFVEKKLEDMFRDNTASSEHASQTTSRPPDYLVNIANETKQPEIGIFSFFKSIFNGIMWILKHRLLDIFLKMSIFVLLTFLYLSVKSMNNSKNDSTTSTSTSSSTSTPTPQGSYLYITPTPTNRPPVQSTYKVGEKVIVNDLEITVEKVKDVVAKYPTEGKKYIAVLLYIKNNKTKSVSISERYDFILKASDDSQYSPSIVEKTDPALGFATVFPDNAVRGWITYEIPKEAKGLSLVFDSSITGGSLIKVELGL
ncbi:MAG: hypothetical protein KatS3mg084_0393 [Candidatus Dojkabacteria bacterium]|nr:MAG: hypothetical protein KatS3mg084_0393 [Candidatus Dojkabacteria bacterium]